MDISGYIGLFGAITGGISFGYNFYRFKEERVSVSVEIIKDDEDPKLLSSKSCFFHARDIQDLYGKPYRAFIQARIINNSSRPISILEFRLKLDGCEKNFLSNEYSVPADIYTFSLSDTQERIIYASRDVLKPIMELPAFAAKEGLIFFPRIDDLPKNEYQAYLEIITSRKNIFSSRGILSEKITLNKSKIKTCTTREIK